MMRIIEKDFIIPSIVEEGSSHYLTYIFVADLLSLSDSENLENLESH